MNEKEIAKLQEEIEKLLKEHPELQEIQDKIDEALEKAGDNVHNRNVVVQEMLLETWCDIVPAVTDFEEYKKKKENEKRRKTFKIIKED